MGKLCFLADEIYCMDLVGEVENQTDYGCMKVWNYSDEDTGQFLFENFMAFLLSVAWFCLKNLLSFLTFFC